MGSLASHPAIPAAASTVYVPVYTPTVTVTPAATTTTNTNPPVTGTGTTTGTDTSTAAGVKSTGLLDRSRGVLSTVLTGFRGILSESNTAAPQRKTLLGE